MTNPAGSMSFQQDPNYVNFDFSAFDGNSTNGGQGGLSPVNQLDPNYVNFDFSAFDGSSTNGGQGGLSPVNQPDPNYISYDFSAFDGNATNGGQGGLAALNPTAVPAAPSAIPSMMGAPTGSALPAV